MVASVHDLGGPALDLEPVSHATVPPDATVDVHATVAERFEQRGTRAVADIRIELDGRPVVTLEHEAIVDLTTAS